MANRSQALLARQLYRTRAKLQRRVPNELIDVASGIENQMAKMPKMYDERFCNHMNSPMLQVSYNLIDILNYISHSSKEFAKNSKEITLSVISLKIILFETSRIK